MSMEDLALIFLHVEMAALLMVFVGNMIFITKPTFVKIPDSFTQNTICMGIMNFSNEQIRASIQHRVLHLG